MLEAAWEYLVKRFQEPSTYNALGLILMGLGFNIAPDHWLAISLIAGVGFGAIGAALSERRKTSATEIKSVVEAVVKPTALDPQVLPRQELERVMKTGNGH